jgi:hypothetical protein
MRTLRENLLAGNRALAIIAEIDSTKPEFLNKYLGVRTDGSVCTYGPNDPRVNQPTSTLRLEHIESEGLLVPNLFYTNGLGEWTERAA